MKRIAIGAIAFAISTAAGYAFAGVQDYGNDPRFGHGDDRRDQRTLHIDRAQVLRVQSAGNSINPYQFDRYQFKPYQPNGNGDTSENRPNNGGGHGAYKVTYRYAGQSYQALMDQRPGRYIRVSVDVVPLQNQ